MNRLNDSSIKGSKLTSLPLLNNQFGVCHALFSSLIAQHLVMDFPCTSCNQLLKRKDTLRDHTKRFHPNSDDESIKCLECEKLFSRISDLKNKKTQF